jgi:hypothetical protein
MILRRHLRIRDRDIAIGTHENRNTTGLCGVGVFGRAISDGGRTFVIAQQIIRKIKLCPERGVIRHRIVTYAKNYGVAVIEILDSITEPVAFNRSPRCIGFWIPPEQDVLAREIVQRH